MTIGGIRGDERGSRRERKTLMRPWGLHSSPATAQIAGGIDLLGAGPWVIERTLALARATGAPAHRGTVVQPPIAVVLGSGDRRLYQPDGPQPACRIRRGSVRPAEVVCLSEDEIRKLAERTDDGDAGRCQFPIAGMCAVPAVKQHSSHARAQRALDVLAHAIPYHDGF